MSGLRRLHVSIKIKAVILTLCIVSNRIQSNRIISYSTYATNVFPHRKIRLIKLFRMHNNNNRIRPNRRAHITFTVYPYKVELIAFDDDSTHIHTHKSLALKIWNDHQQRKWTDYELWSTMSNPIFRQQTIRVWMHGAWRMAHSWWNNQWINETD